MTRGTLIVGASQAGLELAESLRALLPDEPITLLGAETHGPYQRPPLSKTFLTAPEIGGPLEFRSPDFYERTGIDLMLGHRVVDLAVAPGEGGVATTDRGVAVEFARLALTVGARPRRLGVDGAELDGVCYLRTYDDALHLRARVAAARNVVVIGAGFVGLEVAASLSTAGKHVVVVEYADRILPRALSPDVSAHIMAFHLQRGLEIKLSTGVVELLGSDGTVVAVELSDGQRIPADLVVVGVGAIARTELAELIGLECTAGIVVDEFGRTVIDGVVAAGDCTVTRLGGDPATDNRLESVQSAIGQARVAAASLAGKAERNPDVPWFWSDQGELKLQMAGIATGTESHVLRGVPGSAQFSALYYQADRLVGVAAINAPGDYVAARHALQTGRTISADRASDPSAPLKTLIEA